MILDDFNEKIVQWAKEREIDKKGTVQGQSIKTIEEISELIKGLCKGKKDLIADAVGDVYITLILGDMLQEKIDFGEILADEKEIISAWDKPHPKLSDNDKTLFITAQLARSITTIASLKKPYDIAVISNIMNYLFIICHENNISFYDCIESAYNEIKDRKGKVIDGRFVKESDFIC